MKRSITILFVLLIVSGLSFGQSFKIGIGGGLAIVNGPDDLTNDITKGGLGFSSEYQVGLKGKFGLPLLPIKIIGEVNYTLLNGEEDYKMLYMGESFDVKSETEASILSFGVGAEYNLIPGPISPYVNATINFNSISDLKVKSTVKYNGVSYGTEEETYGEKVSRTGIGIGAGVTISILPIVDIDVSAKYNIVNLLGKEDKEDTISTTSIMATVFIGF